MGITIKRSVLVKVIVTEQFKVRRSAELRAALAKLDAAGKQIDARLDASLKRAEAGSEPDRTVAARFQTARRNNERAAAELTRELEKLSATAVGSEYDRGALEGLVELEVGDDFSRASFCEIVVADDKIAEIRDGLCPQRTTETS